MSLRATGEGHISSIVFRSGVLDSDNRVLFNPTSDYVETPEVHLDSAYDRHLFDLKLLEMGASNEVTAHLLGQLPEIFTYNELKNKIESLRTSPVYCLYPNLISGRLMEPSDLYRVPGFLSNGIHAGIKAEGSRDLSLIFSPSPGNSGRGFYAKLLQGGTGPDR